MNLKIVGIDGTARSEGLTRTLLKMAGESVRKYGAHCEIFSQLTHPLPLFDGEKATSAHPAVQALFATARGADAFILSSPEYHGSMSGVLKNALDWLTFDGGGVEVEGRIFGLVGGGGALANSGATLQMMMAVRSLHGWLMPEVVVSVSNIWDVIGSEATGPEVVAMQERLSSFASKMVAYAEEFRIMRSRLVA